MSLLGLLPIIQALRALMFVAKDYFTVSCRIFFGDDLNGGKVGRKPGARKFIGLLGVVAFGHQDELVASGEIGQRLCDAGQQLDLLLGDRAAQIRECARASPPSPAPDSGARSNPPATA